MIARWLDKEMSKSVIIRTRPYYLFKSHFSHKLFFIPFQGGMVGFQAPTSPPGQAPTNDSSQRWVLFSIPDCKYIRVNLSIRLSRDGCQTWSNPWHIHCLFSGYSDMTQYEGSDNAEESNPRFAILYESGINNGTVIMKRFTLADVLRGI